MPWSGSSFSRNTGVYTGATAWAQTDAASRGIRSDDHDTHDQDLADGINACLKKDGNNSPSANIAMGGFKFTGLAAGTTAGDSVRYEQLDSAVLTTRGDILYRGASGNTRLAKGTAGQFLQIGANDPAWASAARIASGTYTGDGATSKAITGVGFTPKLVKIWNRETSSLADIYAYETTTHIIDDNASGAAILSAPSGFTGKTNPVMVLNAIIALGSDGFTVDDGGADNHPNKNGQVYNYLCIG